MDVTFSEGVVWATVFFFTNPMAEICRVNKKNGINDPLESFLDIHVSTSQFSIPTLNCMLDT